MLGSVKRNAYVRARIERVLSPIKRDVLISKKPRDQIPRASRFILFSFFFYLFLTKDKRSLERLPSPPLLPRHLFRFSSRAISNMHCSVFTWHAPVHIYPRIYSPCTILPSRRRYSLNINKRCARSTRSFECIVLVSRLDITQQVYLAQQR